MGGAGDGEGGKGGELRSSPSISTKGSGNFLRVLDLTVAVVVEAPDSVARVDLVDFGFLVDLRVDLGFESDFGVCGPGLDLGEATRFAGEGSESRLCSLSEDASRVGDPFPLGFGFGLVLALGLKSDLAGDNEGDLTLFVASPVIRVSYTVGAGESLDRASSPPS